MNNLITIMKSFIYFSDVMKIFVSRVGNCRWWTFCHIYWRNNNFFYFVKQI